MSDRPAIEGFTFISLNPINQTVNNKICISKRIQRNTTFTFQRNVN